MDVQRLTAPIITYDRHRIMSDGEGVTTLVAFYGCPLRCKWCINSFSHAPETWRVDMTPQALYDKVKIDTLYFAATGGGVTFGGGEPLLYPDFIAGFKGICADVWNICVETSLAVPWENVEKIAPYVDMFYVDCKDMDAEIYKNYTGVDNHLFISNLQKLLTVVPPEKIIIRVPLIPGYNTEENQAQSVKRLKEMGYERFDLFTYVEVDKK